MTNATRFIVLSHGRSGTNFLMNNLAAHPEARVYMEPFHQNFENRNPVGNKRWHTGSSSRQFMERQIFSEDLGAEKAVGFKLFYFHCREDRDSASIWNAVAEDLDIRLIFLNRRNLFDRYVSDLRAQATGRWHPRNTSDWQNDYAETAEIRIDPHVMMNHLNGLYAGYHRVSEQFSDHQSLHLFYEDLESRSEDMLSEAFRFLNLPHNPTRDPFRAGTLTRQTVRIQNEDEIRAVLERSIFADFIATSALLLAG